MKEKIFEIYVLTVFMFAVMITGFVGIYFINEILWLSIICFIPFGTVFGLAIYNDIIKPRLKTKVECWECHEHSKITIDTKHVGEDFYILYPYIEWKCKCGFEHNAYNTQTKENESTREIYNYHKLYEENLGLYNGALDYAIKVLTKQYKRTKNEHRKNDISFERSSLENLKCDLEL